MTTEDTTQTSADVTDETTPAATPDAPEDTLGDAGKRALTSLRQEVKDLQAELKKYQAMSPSDEGQRDAANSTEAPSVSARDAAPTSDATPDAPGNDVQPIRPKFQGTADGGATRGTAAGPRQLSADDLRSMGPRAIEKARRAGELRDLLSGR